MRCVRVRVLLLLCSRSYANVTRMEWNGMKIDGKGERERVRQENQRANNTTIYRPNNNKEKKKKKH